VFFGGAYLGRYSGNFSGDGLDPMGGPPPAKKSAAGPGGGEQQAELTPRDRGKKIYSANCQTCHQANGLGVPGQYPPLAGSEFTTGGSRRPAMIVLKGLQGPVTVKGQKFGSAVMQPWDKTLTDQKIADVLTYERSEWGNNASPVTAEQIAALRKELANHPDSFVEADLFQPTPSFPVVHRRLVLHRHLHLANRPNRANRPRNNRLWSAATSSACWHEISSITGA